MKIVIRFTCYVLKTTSTFKVYEVIKSNFPPYLKRPKILDILKSQIEKCSIFHQN